MITDLQRDILIKAAEGIQEGMWCVGDWFSSLPATNPHYISFNGPMVDDLFEEDSELELEALSKMYRCVEGELAFRTLILGGTLSDYSAVEKLVNDRLPEICENCKQRKARDGELDLFDHNDQCMGPDKDVFTAGQEWADIFRSIL